MSPLEVLVAARALIEDPKRWTQGWYARDAHGQKVPAVSPAACRWCALGAVRRVTGERATGDVDLLIASANEMFCEAVDAVNDGRGHASVLAMYDRAIELASAGVSL